MPRDVVALVSADDFVSAIRVHADRVNDLLRRNHVAPDAAAEISEAAAMALLDTLGTSPHEVVDLAGWWFARVIEASGREDHDAQISMDDEALSLLAGTADEVLIRDALAEVPDSERAAVVLRDGYDLPAQAVGLALRRSGDTAAALTAAGRLHLVAAYDDEPPPNLSGHTARIRVDAVTLSTLADASLESHRVAPLQRHLGNCDACDAMVDALTKGRRLAAGLPIIAMVDEARDAMLDRVAKRAVAVLPSNEAVQSAIESDQHPGPPISPVIAIIVLVLALALGVGVAVVSHAKSSGSAPKLAVTASPSNPSTSQPGSLTPSHHPKQSQRPTHHPSSKASPSHHPSATPSKRPSKRASSKPTKSASHSPSPASSTSSTTGAASVTLSPTHGENGATITVRGGGWQPGTTVTVTYGHTGSASSATVTSSGHFVATIKATAVLPGTEIITAHDGNRTASAPFTQKV